MRPSQRQGSLTNQPILIFNLFLSDSVNQCQPLNLFRGPVLRILLVNLRSTLFQLLLAELPSVTQYVFKQEHALYVVSAEQVAIYELD